MAKPKYWAFSVSASRGDFEWLHRAYATPEGAMRAARKYATQYNLPVAWLTVGELQPFTGYVVPFARGFYSRGTIKRIKWHGVA